MLSCVALVRTTWQDIPEDGIFDGLRIFENRVLWRIIRPKKDRVMGGWRKLHNEELGDLYSSQGITRIIKSMRMRWARNVARMGIIPCIGYW
jgi:hypothetical protein